MAAAHDVDCCDQKVVPVCLTSVVREVCGKLSKTAATGEGLIKSEPSLKVGFLITNGQCGRRTVFCSQINE